MRFSEKIRRSGFWLFDKLKGVKPHLNEISIVISGTDSSKSEVITKKYLTDLISHAAKTTGFYKEYLNQPISGFPVINKNIIRQSVNDFLSSDYSDKPLISTTTSGSTGTPFKTFRDKNKQLRNSADTIFFANLAGYEVGHRLIYLKIWVKEKMSHPYKYWLQNMVPVDVIQLNEDQIEALIKNMEANNSTFGILGYASALELISVYFDKKKHSQVKANVSSIISMSERLNEFTKISLQKYFNVPVVARYSNLENGIIAQQEIDGTDRYLVNTASYYVEILKMKSYEQAKPGELGRIVVTDLFNYAMPMIRYDTGDIGSYEIDPMRPGKLFLSKIEGRKLDLLYDTKGELVSSYIVYKNMWKYTEIQQYQLIQKGEKEYLLKVNVDTDFSKEKELVQDFCAFLGYDAKFEVEYLNEIPLLDSGKRRFIVNEYLK